MTTTASPTTVRIVIAVPEPPTPPPGAEPSGFLISPTIGNIRERETLSAAVHSWVAMGTDSDLLATAERYVVDGSETGFYMFQCRWNAERETWGDWVNA